MTQIDYLTLGKATQLRHIEERIRALETQHFQLSLRVDTPDIGQPPNEQDAQNLARLEESLAKLLEMKAELEGSDS